ncbi:DUF6542 domain-containing protein [Streptomyces sp. NPDC047079]|uniref:DUF6542 domain-containing protein n=1 Tax=Streptomyces sp. NPDC047079 TaxID=3154607 RepID=UPI0033E68258
MEQHRTRPQHHGPRRGAPLPPQGRRGGAGTVRPSTPARPFPPGIPNRPETAEGPPRPDGRDRVAGARPSARGNGGPPRHPAARRNAPPADQAAPPLRGPRLTGLGGGLFCGAVMLALGCLDRSLFGSSLTAYGVLFLPVCMLTALWVRCGDLVIAPVVVPIAFSVGLLPLTDGGGGLGGRLVAVVTALATQAGWLYGGTLIAGVIATVRRVRMMRRRVAQRRRPA